MKLKTPGLMAAALSVLLACETFDTVITELSDSLNTKNSADRDTAQKNAGSPGGSNLSSGNFPAANKRADPDAANWNIAALDTAKDADYLSGVEKDVILEMNKVRTDPKKYAELYIHPRLRYYNGKNYSVPGQITLVTREGAAAVNACVTALRRAVNAGILLPERGLSLAAKDHTSDQGKTGQTGHNGSDRSTPVRRAARYGKGSYIGENISYGYNTGRNIVIQLLIDDGVPSRGHRANIMKSDYTQTGLSIGTHPEYRNMCVIAYAKGYINN